ncbi:MAG: ATP-binding protein [Ignavibacteria bacterium]|nr:ATP-binding protein [Ignavibacteria bacterium]
MSNVIHHTDSITVKAATAKLSAIRNFISNALQQIKLDPEERNGIVLAVDEACTNLIVHGYSLDSTKDIVVDFVADMENIYVTISDSSAAFDPAQADSPDMTAYFQHPRRGGLGILLMNKVMDEVRYLRATAPGTKNQLILCKHRVH